MKFSTNGGQHTSLATLLTPLHVSTIYGQVHVTRWLISHGAHVNALSKSSFLSEVVTPAFFASDCETMKVLLEGNANVLIVPSGGSHMTLTVLHQAYMNGNRALCNLLEEWGGDHACTWLHSAAAQDDWAEVIELLRKGADPNSLGEPVASLHHRTALHWAAICGSTNSAKLLLLYGANVNAVDKKLRTPLHWAARNGHSELVKLLVDHGANGQLVDSRGLNAVACAAETDNMTDEILDDLIRSECDINARCYKKGDTPLHIAITLGHKNTALVLLRKGADFKVENDDLKRPLDCTTSIEMQYAIKKQIGVRDVMISYTHSHSQFATKIREALEEHNITTWLDTTEQTGIRAGAQWREEIAQGIHNCKVVLAIVSEDYAKSQWCLKELALAKEAGKPLFGIKLSSAVNFSDVLQVFLYSRQIISFESAILAAHTEDSKNVAFDYIEDEYQAKVTSLCDGIRDEISRKSRGTVPVSNTRRRKSVGDASHHAAGDAGSDEEKTSVFVCHAGLHLTFVKQLVKAFQEISITCVTDHDIPGKDLADKVPIAKDAILRCGAVIAILSNQTLARDLHKDLIFFSEDKGKPILPVMYSDIDIKPVEFSISRSTLTFFCKNLGFKQSFDQLSNLVLLEVLKNDAHLSAGDASREQGVEDTDAPAEDNYHHIHSHPSDVY